MNHPRNYFSLNSYQGKAYAVGGGSDYGDEVTGPTVEIFVPGRGWALDQTMQMPSYRMYHCSVIIDSRIIVIGGNYAGNTYYKGVIQLDLEAEQKSWTSLASTHYGRQGHACSAGIFQGQPGIYVTGGSNSGNTLVEFYVDSINKWRKLPPMVSNRQHHSMSLINSNIFAHGGRGGEATQERFNQTWTQVSNLSKSRRYHTSVTIPKGSVTCRDLANSG